MSPKKERKNIYLYPTSKGVPIAYVGYDELQRINTIKLPADLDHHTNENVIKKAAQWVFRAHQKYPNRFSSEIQLNTNGLNEEAIQKLTLFRKQLQQEIHEMETLRKAKRKQHKRPSGKKRAKFKPTLATIVEEEEETINEEVETIMEELINDIDPKGQEEADKIISDIFQPTTDRFIEEINEKNNQWVTHQILHDTNKADDLLIEPNLEKHREKINNLLIRISSVESPKELQVLVKSLYQEIEGELLFSKKDATKMITGLLQNAFKVFPKVAQQLTELKRLHEEKKTQKKAKKKADQPPKKTELSELLENKTIQRLLKIDNMDAFKVTDLLRMLSDGKMGEKVTITSHVAPLIPLLVHVQTIENQIKSGEKNIKKDFATELKLAKLFQNTNQLRERLLTHGHAMLDGYFKKHKKTPKVSIKRYIKKLKGEKPDLKAGFIQLQKDAETAKFNSLKRQYTKKLSAHYLNKKTHHASKKTRGEGDFTSDQYDFIEYLGGGRTYTNQELAKIVDRMLIDKIDEKIISDPHHRANYEHQAALLLLMSHNDLKKTSRFKRAVSKFLASCKRWIKAAGTFLGFSKPEKLQTTKKMPDQSNTVDTALDDTLDTKNVDLTSTQKMESIDTVPQDLLSKELNEIDPKSRTPRVTQTTTSPAQLARNSRAAFWNSIHSNTLQGDLYNLKTLSEQTDLFMKSTEPNLEQYQPISASITDAIGKCENTTESLQGRRNVDDRLVTEYKNVTQNLHHLKEKLDSSYEEKLEQQHQLGRGGRSFR